MLRETTYLTAAVIYFGYILLVAAVAPFHKGDGMCLSTDNKDSKDKLIPQKSLESLKSVKEKILFI